MAIPPEDTPNYLSQLTPPTPIDINDTNIADDTNVFASAGNLKDLEEIVNSGLKQVKIWCDVNRLSINFNKTNFMIINRQRKKVTK